MMYRFIDVDELPLQPDLPSEAVNFNGEWLDRTVPGFRTLYVSGREGFQMEVSSVSSKRYDGELYGGRRLLPRTLTIGYQLIAETPEELMRAWNTLAYKMYTEQAQIVVADEQDKYYVGTVKEFSSVPRGVLSLTSEIVVVCSDPCKYSVEEKTVTAEDGVIVVDYKGTYKSYPYLEAEINSDCGYVGFVLNNNALQFGDPDETDDETLSFDQKLFDHGYNGLMEETVNLANVNTDYWTLNGRFYQRPVFNEDEIWYYVDPVPNQSKDVPCTGVSLTKVLPADKLGNVGEPNCRWWVRALMEVTPDMEPAELRGIMRFIMTGTDKNGHKVNIAELQLKKTSGTTAQLIRRSDVMGFEESQSFSIYGDDSWFGIQKGTFQITKLHNTLTYKSYKSTWTYKMADLEDYTVTEVSMYCGGYSDYPLPSLFGLRWSRVDALSVEYDIDAINSMAEGDKLTADCGEAKLYVNDVETPALGVITNNWEAFALRHGRNEITCEQSSWASVLPDYSIRYREVWL